MSRPEPSEVRRTPITTLQLLLMRCWIIVKRAIIFFILQLSLIIGSTILGGILSGALSKLKPTVLWLQFPYSPLLWGTAMAVGFLVNRVLDSRPARWVWVLGLFWLGCFIVADVANYDPRWSAGYSLRQYIWHTYFDARDCLQECLLIVMVTAPAFCSLGYSVGAALALKFQRLQHPR